MNGGKFVAIGGSSILFSGFIYYLANDLTNYTRANPLPESSDKKLLQKDRSEILFFVPLAQGRQNKHPLFVKYTEPYHFAILNNRYIETYPPPSSVTKPLDSIVRIENAYLLK